MKLKLNFPLRIFSLMMALSFAYAVIVFQFPRKDTVDLEDYFFCVDVDDKAVHYSQAYFLQALDHFLPFLGFKLAPLSIFERFVALPALNYPVAHEVSSSQGCRSPPSFLLS